jgi:hypothetical protein
MYILRVATVYEPDVRNMPAEFRTVLTKQDIRAIRSGPEFGPLFGAVHYVSSVRVTASAE